MEERIKELLKNNDDIVDVYFYDDDFEEVGILVNAEDKTEAEINQIYEEAYKFLYEYKENEDNKDSTLSEEVEHIIDACFYLDMEKTGENIKKLLNEKGLTVKTVSEVCLISVQSVYRWIYGETMPTVENLHCLSKLLDVQIEDILVFSQKYTDEIKEKMPAYTKLKISKEKYTN